MYSHLYKRFSVYSRCEFFLKVFEDVLELTLVDALSFETEIDAYAARELVLSGEHPGDTCSKIWDNLDIRGREVVCPWAPPKNQYRSPNTAVQLSYVSYVLFVSSICSVVMMYWQ